MPRAAPPLAGGGESDVGWSRGLRQTPAPLCHSLPPATARIPYAVGLPFLSSSHCQNSLRPGLPIPFCFFPAIARIPHALGLPFLSSGHCQNSLRPGPPLSSSHCQNSLHRGSPLPNSSSHCQNSLRPGPPLPFFKPLPEFLTPWASPSFLQATARIP